MFAILPLLSQARSSQSRDRGPWCPNSSQQLGEQYTVASLPPLPYTPCPGGSAWGFGVGLGGGCSIGKRHAEASRVARHCFPGPWLIGVGASDFGGGAATVGTPSQSCPRSSVTSILQESHVRPHYLAALSDKSSSSWTDRHPGATWKSMDVPTTGRRPCKIVSTHLWNTPKKPLPTGYKPGYLS